MTPKSLNDPQKNPIAFQDDEHEAIDHYVQKVHTSKGRCQAAQYSFRPCEVGVQVTKPQNYSIKVRTP